MVEKKNKLFILFTYFCLSLCFVSCVTLMIAMILYSDNLIGNIFSIIGVIFLAIFSVCYMILGLFAQSNKVRGIIIFGTLVLTIFSLYQGIAIMKKGNQVLIDFVGMDIKEVVRWANDKDILIEQKFQNSDEIEKYTVMDQNIKKGTLLRKISKVTVVVSDGPNEEVETEITSMIGWKLDDVVTFIDKNHLTNVTILFEYHDNYQKDTIFYQDVIDVIKRKEPITLKSSLGKESDISSVTMENLVGMDLFHAEIFLKRNCISYQLEYVYSEDEEGVILKQSIKNWKVVDPTKEEVILTVSRQNDITLIDFTDMTSSEITTWATKNRIKVEFTEIYDESIQKGKYISSNYLKGDIIKVGNTIPVVISKGPLRMIGFTSVEDFVAWAKENDVKYSIDYEFSDKVLEGKLISSSHKKNQIIKNSDMIKLVISQGGDTVIPDLLGLNKKEAQAKCKKANITCQFIGSENESSKVLKQSMRSGSTVPTGTMVTVTLEDSD